MEQRTPSFMPCAMEKGKYLLVEKVETESPITDSEVSDDDAMEASYSGGCFLWRSFCLGIFTAGVLLAVLSSITSSAGSLDRMNRSFDFLHEADMPDMPKSMDATARRKGGSGHKQHHGDQSNSNGGRASPVPSPIVAPAPSPTVSPIPFQNHSAAGEITRGERLCKGGTRVLYHQTDKATCAQILKQGFDMSRAKPGNLGPGIYFADDPAVTNYKTRHHGCIIKALVRLGHVLELGDRWLQDAQRATQTCDPLLGYKLAMPGGEQVDSLTTIKHGRERSIFFNDQIIDMVAYHTDSKAWVNGRQQLNVSTDCNPDEFKMFSAPECASPKPLEYACNWHPISSQLQCKMDGRGNCCASPNWH